MSAFDKVQIHKTFWFGTIYAKFEDKAQLEGLGIRLGRYVFEDKVFLQCSLTEDAYSDLELFRRKYSWDLSIRFKVLCPTCNSFMMHLTEDEYLGRCKSRCKKCHTSYRTNFYSKLNTDLAIRRVVFKQTV